MDDVRNAGVDKTMIRDRIPAGNPIGANVMVSTTIDPALVSQRASLAAELSASQDLFVFVQRTST